MVTFLVVMLVVEVGVGGVGGGGKAVGVVWGVAVSVGWKGWVGNG